MGGLPKSLESVLKGLALAATIGISSFSSSDSFAQQKQVAPQKQERKIQEEKKAEVPDEQTIKFREDQVKKAFSEDYKKKDAAAKLTLADKLSKSSDDPKNDVALTYVLKQEAIKAYAEGLDLSSAFNLAERVAESYNTSGLRLKCTSFNIARRQPVKDADQASSLSESGYELTGDLYIKGDFSSALEIVGEAKKITKLPKEAVQKLADLESEIKIVQSAENILMAMPDDVKANTTFARYTAFRCGKIKEAKEYAKKSNDSILNDLLDAELANPDTSESQYQLANQYFEASKKLKGFEKDQYLMRASFLYNEALPNANALVKADIEKRLKEMGPKESMGKGTIDLMKMIDLNKDSVKGKWKHENASLISPTDRCANIQLPYIPPNEYDIKLTVRQLSDIAKDQDAGVYIGLAIGERQFGVHIDGWKQTRTRLYMWKGKNEGTPGGDFAGALLSKDKYSTIQCAVRSSGIKVIVDGKNVIDYKGDYADLSLWHEWKVNDPRTLIIGTVETSYHIKEYKLTPISGSGKRLR